MYIKKIGKFGNQKYLYNLYKRHNILLFIISISFLISKQKQSSDKINKLIYDTEVILTINGIDKQQIIYNGFYPKPSKILVNGNITNNLDNYVII